VGFADTPVTVGALAGWQLESINMISSMKDIICLEPD
jgi:hypothetical protein